jgi:signal transduction histidine kinase
MPNEKLRATVTELERELLASDTVDAATRERLQNALAEVRAALQESETTAEDRRSLAASLTKAVEEFEGSHPTLVSIIGRLADGLSQMGI